MRCDYRMDGLGAMSASQRRARGSFHKDWCRCNGEAVAVSVNGFCACEEHYTREMRDNFPMNWKRLERKEE